LLDKFSLETEILYQRELIYSATISLIHTLVNLVNKANDLMNAVSDTDV